jgi:tetratricopeptide (TPR) repeat protein
MTAAEATALARQYYQTGQLAAAEHMFRYVLELDPANTGALHALAILALQARDAKQGLAYLKSACEIEPNNSAFWNDLAVAHNQVQNFREGIAACERALRLQPEFGEAYNNLGFAYFYLSEYEKAVAALHQAIRLRPEDAEAFANLGAALKQLGKREAAAEALTQAVRLNPNKVDAANLGGMVYQELGNLDQAIECYRHALRVRPDYADACNNLATAYKELGLLDESVAQYRETLRLHPDHAFAYYNLSQFVAERRHRFTEEDFRRLRELAVSVDRQRVERSVLAFALAGALDAQGDYEEAFHYYRLANELRHTWLEQNNRAFDAAGHRDLISDVIATFERAYFERAAEWGEAEDEPILILGMPRSGTTLVSHILSSHPAVFGAGELGAFPQLVAEQHGKTIVSSRLPPPVPFASAAAARDMAARFLQRLQERAKGKPRVAVKTLENFVYLGMIATALPRTRVLYCRRDPRDTCLSCYFQNFQGMDYAFSLEDIAAYYNQYERLMNHWREVAPLPILDVPYEDLIADPEEVIRGMLAHCGLDWDERCLAFYNTRRPVQTASTLQVRKPLSPKSIGRWKNYAAHLEPLLQALQCPQEAEAGV